MIGVAPDARRTGFWVRRPCGPGRTSGVWGHVRATFDFADAIPRLNGKTLFEILYKKKPLLLYLYIYSYRAYPLRYNIPRLKKIEPRAYISYLVS